MNKCIFLNAVLLQKKGSDAPPWLKINVYIDGESSERSTGGDVKDIWVKPQDADLAWQIVRSANFGDTLIINKVISTRGTRDYIDYEIVGIE